MTLTPEHQKHRAFSLIELLTVIALIGGLMTLGLKYVAQGSQSPRQAAQDLSDVIRAAKAHAVAQNTYAIVGLRNAVVEGRPTLEVATYYSLDGAEPLAAANADAALASMGKIRRYPTMQVQPQSSKVDDNLDSILPKTENFKGLSEAPFNFNGPRNDGAFQWRLLVTPSGEISLQKADSLATAALIGISLTRSAGAIPPATAGVIIRGTVGQAFAIEP